MQRICFKNKHKNFCTLILYLIILVLLISNSLAINKQSNEIRVLKNILEETKDNNNVSIPKFSNYKVILLGSSVTEGEGASSYEKSWAGLMQSNLEKANHQLDVINLGVGGYTTFNVLSNSLKKVPSLKPNIIILETCLINDFYQKFTVSQSNENIQQIMNYLTLNLPKTKIYLMPPNKIGDLNTRSSEGLIYEEYVSQVGEYIKSKGWNYIDYWSSYEKGFFKLNMSLQETLNDDKIHPNDKGYKIWFNSIKDSIIQEEIN